MLRSSALESRPQAVPANEAWLLSSSAKIDGLASSETLSRGAAGAVNVSMAVPPKLTNETAGQTTVRPPCKMSLNECVSGDHAAAMSAARTCPRTLCYCTLAGNDDETGHDPCRPALAAVQADEQAFSTGCEGKAVESGAAQQQMNNKLCSGSTQATDDNTPAEAN